MYHIQTDILYVRKYHKSLGARGHFCHFTNVDVRKPEGIISFNPDYVNLVRRHLNNNFGKSYSTMEGALMDIMIQQEFEYDFIKVFLKTLNNINHKHIDFNTFKMGFHKSSTMFHGELLFNLQKRMSLSQNIGFFNQRIIDSNNNVVCHFNKVN